MAKEFALATTFSGPPVTLHTKHPVTARGTVNTFFGAGPHYALTLHINGVIVRYKEKGGTPAVDVLVPWSNVANVNLGRGE